MSKIENSENMIQKVLSGATKIKDIARKQQYGTFVSAAPPSLISLSIIHHQSSSPFIFIIHHHQQNPKPFHHSSSIIITIHLHRSSSSTKF